MPFRNILFFKLCTRASTRMQQSYGKEVDNMIAVYMQFDVVCVCSILTLAINGIQLALSVLSYIKK